MNGELGVIYQNNKQLGGFYDWEIEIIPNSTLKDGWQEFKIAKEITVQSYWLNFAPDNNCFESKFYKVIRGQLVLMDGGKVEINLPNRTLGCRLYIPLKIRWVGN